MEARLKDKQSVEATVEVTVPAKDVDAAFSRVLSQLSRSVRVPGFRPGKAPRGILIKRIGEETLQNEVREELIDKTYPDAIREFDLAPIHAHVHGGMPEEGKDFTFDFHMDLYPDIVLPELSEIVIDTEAQKVDDEMVQATVSRLQSENATLVPVDRPSEPGDHLLIQTVGEDGSEPGEDASTMPLDLENVSDELAEQVIGKKIGDIVTLEFAAPAPAQEEEQDEADEGAQDGESDEAPEAQETRTTLKIRIADIKEKDKPEANDDLAKTLGFDNWEEALEDIRRNLQEQLDRQAFEEQRDEFVEKLIENSNFDLPTMLVRQRQQALLENLVDDLRERGMSLDDYLKSLEENEGREEFEKELLESAQNAVRRDLVLERLLDQRGTTLSDAEFEASLRQLAQEMNTDPVKLRQERGEQWIRNYRFLLTRDRALNETVRELVDAQYGTGSQDAQPAGEEESSNTDGE